MEYSQVAISLEIDTLGLLSNILVFSLLEVRALSLRLHYRCILLPAVQAYATGMGSTDVAPL